MMSNSINLRSNKKLFSNIFQTSKYAFSIKLEEHFNFLRAADESSNKHYDFHYFWLRHNCGCLNGCIHPKTKERVTNITDVNLEISPKYSTVQDDKLIITWSDNHTSAFSIDFLEKHAYSVNKHIADIPHHNSNDLEVVYSATNKKQYFEKCLDNLTKYGIAVIRKRGLDTEEIIQEFGGNVIHSHFGRIEDLKSNNTTNKNNDQLGYTTFTIDLHTDQPFLEKPPGIQILHCINRADEGGVNFFSNSVKIALYIKSIDPEAFKILTTCPVNFHRKQQNFETNFITPLIKLNYEKSTPEDPVVDIIRSSYFTYDPFNLNFDQMEKFYRALALFTKMSKKYKYEALLNSGDFVIYNNHHMLHARSSFRGERHMRGVYFNIEDVYQHLTQLI